VTFAAPKYPITGCKQAAARPERVSPGGTRPTRRETPYEPTLRTAFRIARFSMSGDTPGESAMARNAQTTANSDRER
jgi:hypothetical protein